MNRKRLAGSLTFGSSESLNRPAWTQYDQHAYRHKHCLRNGRFVKIIGYYEKTLGCR